MTTPTHIIAFACAAIVSLASLQAATYDQTIYNPGSSFWNGANVWGGNAVTADNDYRSVPDPNRIINNTPIETSFTVDVGGDIKAWTIFGQVQDTSTGVSPQPAPQSTTFAGNSIIFTSGTRLTSKGANTTTTANFVLEDNSHLLLGPNTSGETTFAGSISVSGLTAIGIRTNGTTTLNVDAPITGTGTLQLVTTGAAFANLNLNGDISGFTGTLLLSNSTTKITNSGIFSIANSATFATLQLNYESPLFFYDLADNEVSFASLVLGVDNVLAPGTYDAGALNFLTGNAGIFFGDGTITVVPEPSTYALGMLGLLVIAVAMRRGQRA